MNHLADLISRLTHHVDRLEVTRERLVRSTCSSTLLSIQQSLSFEIAMLHTLIDDMNALYEEEAEKAADYAFEALD